MSINVKETIKILKTIILRVWEYIMLIMTNKTSIIIKTHTPVLKVNPNLFTKNNSNLAAIDIRPLIIIYIINSIKIKDIINAFITPVILILLYFLK